MDTRATIFVTLAAMGCLAYSCGKVDAPQTAKQTVEIEVSVDGQTPSRVGVSTNVFDTGDEFRFFFNSDVPTNDTPPGTGSLKIADYVYGSDSRWATQDPIYWDDYQAVQRDFCAALPFSGDYDVTATPHTFTVQGDQTAESEYKASDLLMARVRTDRRLIPLKFYHVMSKVVVEVKATTGSNSDLSDLFSETAFDEMTATLHVQRMGAITFDDPPTEDKPNIKVLGSGTSGEVSMLKLSGPTSAGSNLSMKFTALIPPQTIAKETVMLTLNNVERAKTYYMKVSKEDAKFERGKSTIVTVNLSKQKVEIDDAAIKITEWGDITISSDDPIVLPD